MLPSSPQKKQPSRAAKMKNSNSGNSKSPSKKSGVNSSLRPKKQRSRSSGNEHLSTDLRQPKDRDPLLARTISELWDQFEQGFGQEGGLRCSQLFRQAALVADSDSGNGNDWHKFWADDGRLPHYRLERFDEEYDEVTKGTETNPQALAQHLFAHFNQDKGNLFEWMCVRMEPTSKKAHEAEIDWVYTGASPLRWRDRTPSGSSTSITTFG